jgi:quinol monooxygenase YgiN
VAPTRSEEGCINYDLNRDVEDPLEIMLYENRRSKAELDERLSSPHMEDLLDKLPELSKDGVEITLFEIVGYAPAPAHEPNTSQSRNRTLSIVSSGGVKGFHAVRLRAGRLSYGC